MSAFIRHTAGAICAVAGVLFVLPLLAAPLGPSILNTVQNFLPLAYLAFPIDLVPGFIPVLGYADDAIVVAAVLRWVVRRSGIQAIRRQWPGTDDGFAVLYRLAGLPVPQNVASSGEQRSASAD